MKSKHTPGPWRLSGDGVLIAKEGAFYRIATVREPRSANARLIAAAPELLEALENLVNLVSVIEVYPLVPTDELIDDWLAEPRAAIAKAKGEA